MPTIRLIPAIATGLIAFVGFARAQGPAGLPPTPGGIPIPGVPKDQPTDAEKTVDEAIARIKTLGSFSAEITQSVSMLDQKFEIKGVYHKATDNRVYLKLEVLGLGDTKATTLQVSDGETLWDYQQVLDTQLYRKLTLPTILKKLNDPVLDPNVREQFLGRMGFSGPEAMLVGLRKAVRFNQKAAGEFEGKKVWVVRGEWVDRAALTAPGQQPLPSTVPLPPYIPSNVAVTLGQTDGWPYQVTMLGNVPSILQEKTQKIGIDGRTMGPKVAAPTVQRSDITLKYANVQLNPKLPPETFAFDAPPGAKNVIDETEQLLADLDMIIQNETSRKRAEASQSNDPSKPPVETTTTLPTTLDVPKSADPTAPSPKP